MSMTPDDLAGDGLAKHAPEVGLAATWIFKLSKHDALLVLKALGGRLNAHEVAEAKALGDRLTELRHRVGHDFHGGLERAYQGMVRARADEAAGITADDKNMPQRG